MAGNIAVELLSMFDFGATSQKSTNGLSPLGSLKAPRLAAYLPDNLLSVRDAIASAVPWGDRTVQDTNPKDMPETDVTRSYDFIVSRTHLNPDGVTGPVMVINGEFPGPTIEANWGDWIEVTVRNQISGPEEGTAMHFHGMTQNGNPWYDGVPGVGQCPIASGQRLKYRFRADRYGTTWYHSHYSAQYSSGVQGPLIVHGPTHVNYDEDLGPIMLTDWFHDDYWPIIQQVMAPSNQTDGFRPFSVSNLINGKGYFPCSNITDGTPCTNTGISKFQFHSGKAYRLRLVNSGAEPTIKFSIDNHTMTVMANDFVPIKPYDAEIVTLAVGQRTDVVVQAKGSAGDSSWMRSTFDSACSDTNSFYGLAAVYYEDANTMAAPRSIGYEIPPNLACTNDPLNMTEPAFSMTPSEPATTLELRMDLAPNASLSRLWTMNNSSFYSDLNSPVMLEAIHGNDTFGSMRNVFNMGSNGSVRLIMYNDYRASHPMHLHGHDFWVLAEGQGVWDGKIMNPQNPQRRDTQQIASHYTDTTPTYTVLQWVQDNPGVWPFHCHVAWHLSAGMYINIMESPADMEKFQVPDDVLGTCDTWKQWQKDHYTSQVDSGV